MADLRSSTLPQTCVMPSFLPMCEDNVKSVAVYFIRVCFEYRRSCSHRDDLMTNLNLYLKTLVEGRAYTLDT